MRVSNQEPSKPSAPNEWSASTRWRWFGLALLPALLMPLGEWLSWRDSFAHHLGLLIGWFGTIPMAGPIIAVPVCLLGLCWQRHRRNAAWALLCWLLALGSVIAGLLLAWPIKYGALAGVMHRAEPLITAIRKFEAEQGKPPPDLAALVPDHLATLPTPGIGTAPQFSYLLAGARTGMGDNPWMLEVHPPVAFIGFDVFIYLPKQNYPERGWGGVLERIGTWAYVHE